MPDDLSRVGAEVFTQFHRYTGQVNTRGCRLADFLNNATTEVVEMYDVQVTEPTNPSAEPLNCKQLHLKKDAILVAVPTGQYEAPAKRLYSYIEKNHYKAHVLLPGCWLVGTVHLPDRANRWLLLCESCTTPSFIPITDVEVQFATREAKKLQMKVAIFRRQYIQSLFIGEHEDRLQSLQQLSAELRAIDPDNFARDLVVPQPADTVG